MNRAETNARKHGKHCFRNHRHIDQNAIAFADTLLLQHRRAAIYLAVQLAKCVCVLFICFSGDVYQRTFISAAFQMTIDRVMTQVRFATQKPACERRPAGCASPRS